MGERPILFSDAMVRAILAGRKTVTRRIVAGENRPNPGNAWAECCCRDIDPSDTPCVVCFARFQRCPAEAGDRLWVREAWNVRGLAWSMLRSGRKPKDVVGIASADAWIHRATPPERWVAGWRPSIHMPRAACRLLLDVVDVRVERLQGITPADIAREGVDFTGETGARVQFRDLWDSINGKRPGCAWDANPWVWRVAFRPVEAAAPVVGHSGVAEGAR